MDISSPQYSLSLISTHRYIHGYPYRLLDVSPKDVSSDKTFPGQDNSPTGQFPARHFPRHMFKEIIQQGPAKKSETCNL